MSSLKVAVHVFLDSDADWQFECAAMDTYEGTWWALDYGHENRPGPYNGALEEFREETLKRLYWFEKDESRHGSMSERGKRISSILGGIDGRR